MVKTPVNTLLKGIGQIKNNDLVESVVTDSRKAVENTIFVCIKGERVDGHDFAKKAIEQGAICVLSQRELQDVESDKTIIVSDPLDAMIKIGENYRDLFSPKLIAVTGSVGKTTTKEFCSAVFDAFGKTVKTQGNQNNEIGMPNTLMQIDTETEFAIVEMGMQGLGEIEKLSLAAKPDAAIISCIGIAHLEQLKTKENILKAKLEICSGMKEGAPLILNGDDEMLYNAKLPKNIKPVFFAVNNKKADITAKNIVNIENGMQFIICDKNDNEYKTFIPAFGIHNVLNALSAFALATSLGLNAQKAAQALNNYETTGQRQKLVKFNGISVFEDCYNASPDSMKAALSTLKDYENQNNKIAVLGDMFELGSQSKIAHENIAKLCKDNDINLLIAIGDLMGNAHKSAQNIGLSSVYFEDKEKALKSLGKLINKGDAVLFKASNGMKFNELLDGFYNVKEEGKI